ncbi:hypothetical protein KI372_03840 [Halobacterium salinarum]|uniref:hypothetical protein n=1 Tax=Halobacterium salinarum TaxID=2242 RepID=UPI001F325C02|nr:hypothetical protein [Halobacterium salinarum]MCF2207973.1 hypothetical protein [Halobacterium salinarum]MCF2240557.1 hypothetical protein [Halobacterium salinarum]
MELNTREVAFVMEQMQEVEHSERSSPTERAEAERIRRKAERRLIGKANGPNPMTPRSIQESQPSKR